MRRLACFVLALALAASVASAETAFSFRGGVTWDTAPEQMLTLEGLSQGDYNRQDLNGYTFFYLIGKNIYYVYRGDSLVQAYTVMPESAYAAELEAHTAACGAPADIDADTAASLWNTLLPGSLTPDEMGALVAWRLSDGTLAALFATGGKTCMAYFHEQRILGGE